MNLTDITDKFTFDGQFETGSDESCSFQLHNQMYIVGGTYGAPFARQISIMKPNALVKSGVVLPEEFTAPSCQSVDGMAYICSPYNHKNWCYQVDLVNVLRSKYIKKYSLMDEKLRKLVRFSTIIFMERWQHIKTRQS